MNQTLPRCLQCGENPRMVVGRSEFAVDYHPLCQECHWVLWEKSQREAGLSRGVENSPEKKSPFFVLFVRETRFIALGAMIFSVLQLPMISLGGPFFAVVHAILIAIAAPWAAAGFWLNRRKW